MKKKRKRHEKGSGRGKKKEKGRKKKMWLCFSQGLLEKQSVATYYTLCKKKPLSTIFKLKGADDMSYAVLHIEKIKDKGSLKSRWIHDERRTDIIGHDIPNTDPARQGENRELIALPVDEKGEQMTYNKVWDKRFADLEFYKTHKLRKDAVLAYDVVLSYSRDESIDVDKWAKQSVEWLKKTFNKAGDGKDNVLHAVLHMDEENTHIHALVIPVDEKCHLNTHAYTGGRKLMRELQTSYSKAVANLGIERGVMGSTAKHENIHKMYAKLDKAIQVPDVEKGETAEEYRSRVMEDIQTQKAVNHREAEELKAELRRKIDNSRNVQQNELLTVLKRSQGRLKQQKQEQDEEIKRERKSFDSYVNKQKDDLSKKEADLKAQTEELEKAKAQFEVWRRNEERELARAREELDEDKEDAEEYRKIKLAMAYAKEHFPDYYQDRQKDLNWMDEEGQRIKDGVHHLSHSHGMDRDGRTIHYEERDEDELER